MNKILLIIEREFMSRVKKKSFIVMTLLTPILFAALMVGPSLLANMESTELTTIAVVDNSKQFEGKIAETNYIKLKFLNNESTESLKKNFEESGYYAFLYINKNAMTSPDSIILYSNKQPSIDVVSHISNSIEKEIETQKLKAYKIENIDEIMKTIKTKIDVRTIKLSKGGEEKESNTFVTMAVAYVLSFMVYMMIFLFGTQVMRGVIEEKTSRIVEVIVSSVKPFQLMMGKIIGIAAVSLVQILAWVVLTFAIVNTVSSIMTTKNIDKIKTEQQSMSNLMQQQGGVQTPATMETKQIKNEFMTALGNQNFGLLIGGFIFYFLGGFLLYAALFAAVGSAVDSETDTQQMVMPITLPLILSIIIMISGIKSPDGPLAFWFSMIPFTSPIIMLTRLPFGVPTWQLIVSGSLLIITFIVVTWMAAKIYRTGILLYGKKYSWAEMWKWVRYKS